MSIEYGVFYQYEGAGVEMYINALDQDIQSRTSLQLC